MKNHLILLLGVFIVGASIIVFLFSTNGLTKKPSGTSRRIELITNALARLDEEALEQLKPTPEEYQAATDRVTEQTLALMQEEREKKQETEQEILFRRIELLAESLRENSQDDRLIKQLEPTREEFEFAQQFNEIKTAHLNHEADLKKRYDLMGKYFEAPYKNALKAANEAYKKELAEFKMSLPTQDPKRPRLPFAPQ